ncbi:MAG: hypothetical protein ACYC6F_02435 [Longimicrobiales bacterium]
MKHRSAAPSAFLACLALLVAAQGSAQEAPPASSGVLRSILLPAAAETLRQLGVPAREVEAAVMGARERRVPPQEAVGIFEETARTVEEHGPIDNFGAFIQERLGEGLRGQDLAAAIRAEHARRGIGKGKKLESPGQGRGRPGGMDQPGGMGQPGAGERGPGAAERGRGRGQRPDTIRDTIRRPRGGGR